MKTFSKLKVLWFQYTRDAQASDERLEGRAKHETKISVRQFFCKPRSGEPRAASKSRKKYIIAICI